MARDSIHFEVRKALEKDGWKITADPLVLQVAKTKLFVDLESEKVIEAERKGERIAVEIKSLKGKSILYAFYPALGKYLLYRDALDEHGFLEEVWLATTPTAYHQLQSNEFLMRRIKQYKMKILLVDPDEKIIVSWIK